MLHTSLEILLLYSAGADVPVFAQTRFPGRLCITSRHACFHAQREDLSFAVQLAASIQVGKVAAPKQVIFKTGSLEQGALSLLGAS